jgi:type IV pilus assembly protein PilY1
MLIDTSGSMVFSDLLDGGEVQVGGDGTKSFSYDGAVHGYYGKDIFPGNNSAAQYMADGVPVKDENGRPLVNFNYHPKLVYIPQAEINRISNPLTAPAAPGSPSDPAPLSPIYSRFARFSDGDIIPSNLGEGLSIFKYPNDSRLYILKNVMYRLLHDEAIYKDLRLALAGYYQIRKTTPITPSSSHYYNDETYSGSWAWAGPWNNRRLVYSWATRSGNAGIYWESDLTNRPGRGILHEPFKSTTDATHLANLRKWFSGDTDLGVGTAGSDSAGSPISREFRAHGYTPLADSIYNTSAGSALQYFKSPGVITDYCQENWLIVLTDGADQSWEKDLFGRWYSFSKSVVNAVRNLNATVLNDAYPKQRIKTFVVGFVNDKKAEEPGDEPWRQRLRTLVQELRDAADVGGTGKPAYFASDMQGLFDVLRGIFRTIQEAEGRTGGAPIFTPARGPQEETVLYLPSHDALYQRQWKGYLRKETRNVREDGSVHYEKAWEASERLNAINWDDRKIITSYQGLTDSGSNCYPLVTDNAATLKNALGLSEDQSRDFIAWLRGKDVYDEEKGADQLHKLYDINHSGLLKIGAPAGGVLGELYAVFREALRNRQTVVYCQSNAGMLHAFDDQNGDERFAFIPPNVLSGGRLRALRWDLGTYSSGEASYPRYLLNGPVVAEDVLVGNEYRTLLMGLLGPGGPGMYVLDVTDVARVSSAGVPMPDAPRMLWAIENSVYAPTGIEPSLRAEVDRKVFRWSESGTGTVFSAYSHVGMASEAVYDYRLLRRTVSRPFIGRVFVQESLVTGPEWSWVFLMGSGIPSGMTDDQLAGALYVGKMNDGSIMKKYDASAPVSSLIAPVHRQQEVYGRIRDFVAGDILGMVYKGDLFSRNKTEWKWHSVLEFPKKAVGTNKNGGVFRGLNAALLKNELWLFAGTGEVLDFLPEPEEDVTNYFAAANISGLEPGDAPFKVVNDLTKLNAGIGDDDGDFDNNLDRNGWYIQFSQDETMSTSPLLYRNEYIFFFTFVPDSSDPCAENGSSYFYVLNRRSGKAPEGWTKKFLEFKGLKVTGIAMANDDLAAAVTVLNPEPGAGENLSLRQQIVGGVVPNVHETLPGLSSVVWELEILPSYWKVR